MTERIPSVRAAADCLRRQAGAALAELLFRLPAYNASLIGRHIKDIRGFAPDPWPGIAAFGDAIVGGRFALAGETVAGDLALWNGKASPAWQEAFHSFEWLRDLRALGGEVAHQRARKLVKDWIAANERWSRSAWRGDVMGRRLSSWIAHYDFFAAGADAVFRESVLARIARETRHLARIVPGALEGAALLSAAKGLALASLALPGFSRLHARAMDLLSAEMPRQILADGGHVERCPSLQLSILRDLVDLRAALVSAQQPAPGELLNAIDRMAPMLRFFRLGDGALTVFNGGGEEEGWVADLVLSRAEARGKPLPAAPHTGFQRLSAGRAVVVLDAGTPARLACSGASRAHAGTLAFEMSMGKDRVVVNCGAHPMRSPAWSIASRATAAHSTLVVADTNSADVTEKGLRGGPRKVTASRTEAADGVAVEARHDGYAALFGLVHARALRLSSSGDELHGEDALIALGQRRRKRTDRPFAIRFHLHPDAKASLVGDNKGVLVKLPSGLGMRFSAAGGDVTLEDSVYLGSGTLRKSQQIVVNGIAKPMAEGEATLVTWSWSRVGYGP